MLSGPSCLPIRNSVEMSTALAAHHASQGIDTGLASPSRHVIPLHQLSAEAPSRALILSPMNSPLQDPSYLLSIVQIIAESLYNQSSASIHNLLDAYATFVNRVRAQSHLLQDCDTLLPALDPLRIHKDDFVRALRRDVRLAHIDPFSNLSHTRSSLDEILFGSSIYLNIGINTKQYARDSSLLCHHALCALATIFRFPAFHSAFPGMFGMIPP